jgi:hypothetical protein
LNSTVSATIGRVRDFRLEAALGASFMLLVVATAYGAGAAVTTPTLRSAEPTPPAPIVDAAPAEPVEPEPILVMGEPVPGHEINSPFGLRRLPWENHGRLHEGVDIAAPIGQPVLAAAEGFVMRSGNSSSYGRFVEIVHAEGLTTLYAHLGRIDPRAMKAGAKIAAGQAIGKIGSSGTSTGPHVHFEIRKKNKPLNPTAFMGREFATAEELPLKAAARYSKRVRVAQVSFIPETKRALMAGKDAKIGVKKGKDGRPRQTLQFTSKPTMVVEEAPSATSAGVDTSAILPIPPMTATSAD